MEGDGVTLNEPDSDTETNEAGALPAESLSIAIEHAEGATVVVVAGEVDALTAPQLVEAIDTAWQRQPEVVVVDLLEVGFLASAGLAALVAAHHQAAERGAKLRVAAGDRVTFRPIHLTGVDAEIAVFGSRQQALDAAE